MPYVPTNDRPVLNTRVDRLAEEIANGLIAKKETVELSERYRENFNKIFDTLYMLETKPGEFKPKTKAEELAYEIFDVAKKYGYKGAWLGELNYSITMLIQVVPYKMVRKGAWKEELRYWLYAQTVGALVRTASDIDKRGGGNWAADGAMGVFEDIKDEYKRRVNPAYETVQIIKSGDCYITPYHTVPVEFKDADGKVGWVEVEKDFRETHIVDEIKDEKGNVIGWKQVMKK